MGALEDAVAALNQAIQDANSRFQVAGDVEAAVAAEREKYDALVAAEESEDQLQNQERDRLTQELNDARAQTDAAVTELNSAAESIQAAADQVNTLGQTVQNQSSTEESASTDASTDAPTEGTTETASPSDAGGDTTAEVSPTTDTTPSENPTDAAPTDTPTAGDVMRADEEAQQSDPTSTRNMDPNV